MSAAPEPSPGVTDDDPRTTAAVEPLRAAKRREAEKALDRARLNLPSWDSLPLLALLMLAYVVLHHGFTVRALFWSPPPPVAWRSIDGELVDRSTYRRTYLAVRNTAGEMTLSCAPGLSNADACSYGYNEVLRSRMGVISRFHVVEHKGWFGSDFILTRVEDEGGRHVDYPQFRLTLRDFSWTFWTPLLAALAVFAWQAAALQRAERRLRSL